MHRCMHMYILIHIVTGICIIMYMHIHVHIHTCMYI